MDVMAGRGFRSLLLAALLSAACSSAGIAFAQSSGGSVHLAPTTSPSVGQSAVTSLNLIGANYPSGTISAGQVQITLTPAKPGTGSTVSFPPSSVTTLFASSRRLTFTIPSSVSVASPVPYLVSMSGQTTTGVSFSSANSSALTIDPPAQIASVSPNSASAGQSLTVTISGKYTNFFQGSTVASFGAGISVGGAPSGSRGPVTVIDQSSATVQLAIDSTADSGPRTPTVQTGVQVAMLVNGFKISAGTPVNQPPVVSAGLPQSISLAGRVVVGHDVNTLSTSVAGPNEDQFAVNLAQWLIGATSGNILAVESAPGDISRDYAPSVKSALASAGFAVTYVSSAATVAALKLADLQPYDAVFVGETYSTQTSITSSVLVQYLNGGGSVYMYGGVDDTAAEEAAILNPFLQVLGLAFDTTNYNGLYAVDITSTHPIFKGLTGKPLGSGNGQDILDLGTNANASIIQFQGQHGVYAVVNPLLAVASLNGAVSDDGLPVGATLTAAWSEINGPSPVSFSNPTAAFPDIAGKVNPVITSATFSAPGTYILALTGSDSKLSSSATVTITVNAPTPTILLVNPNSGEQGQQNLSVAITGLNTHFAQGKTTASFGAGIALASVTVNSATSATAVLNIDAAAAVGPHEVTLKTGTEVATLPDGFAVQAVVLPPTITAVTPNSGQRGQQGLSVRLTGQNTHFAQGTTTASFGPGITVASLTINSPASATAVLSIDASAAVGPRDIVATTRGEQASLKAGFTVVACPSQGWTRLNQSGSLPSMRLQHSVVYDEVSKRLIAFGGTDREVVDLDNDTWVLINANGSSGPSVWNLITPTGSLPPRRRGHSAAYDPKTNRMIVFAGDESIGQLLNDVWVLTDANGLGGTPSWQHLSPNGPAPLPRRWAEAAYDSASNRLVVFGGETSATTRTNDVWILSNANGLGGTPAWTQLNPAGTRPSPRAFFYANLDTANNRLMVFGGGDVVNGVSDDPSLYRKDSFVLTNANGLGGTPTWISVVPEDAKGSPSPRLTLDGTAASVYVPKTNQFVIFGGAIGECSGSIVTCPAASISPDVWILSNANGTGGAPLWAKLPLTGGPQRTGTNVAYDSATDTAITYGGGYESLVLDHVTSADTWLLTDLTGTACSTAPSLRSVSPDTAQQGQQNLSVALTGQNTHFVQGKTSASFGAGITVVSVTVNSAASATAVLNIDSAAVIGPRTVTVTTGTEVASLVNGFTVASGPVNQPPAVSAGANQTITPFTDQFEGPSISPFWTLIGPGTANLTSSMSHSGKQSLQLSAVPTYPWWATATHYFGSQVSGSVSVWINGSQLCCGTAASLGIVNTSDNWAVLEQSQDSNCLSCFTARVSGSPESDYHFTASATDWHLYEIDTGPSGVTFKFDGAIIFTNPSVTNFREIDFTVWSSPSGTGYFDDFSSSVAETTLNGSLTDDGLPVGATLTGTWTMASGPGSISFSNPTQTFPDAAGKVNPVVTSAAFSDPGKYILKLTGSDSKLTSSATVTITVNPPTPTVLLVAPNSGQQAQQNLSVAITGQNTHFAQGKTTASFGAGIAVSSLTVNSVTSATAVLNIDAAAAVGPRDVTLKSGTELATLGDGFAVQPGVGLPLITTVTPNSGQQGQQKLSIAITGQNTHFVQRTTTANFGAGITLASLTVNSSTSATAVLNIDAAAATGPRTVTLTTGSEVATLLSGFMVVPPGPSITTVSPNAGPQGGSGLVGIAGQNTHFAQGKTQVSFGAGITVSNINVGCPTCLQVTLTINATAALGPRTVTVTTGSEVVSLPNGFTVASSGTTPILTSIHPINVQQGESVSIAITGQNTHWVQANTQVSFGAGITTTAVSVINATSLSVQISVDPAATVGYRTVTVTTGAEVASVANVFQVLAATPTLYSLSPGSGEQGQQNLSVAIVGKFTHFLQASTKATFGAGITIVSLTVGSATTATAVVNIGSAATLGTRTVTLTTGSEVASFTNGFTISAPTPTIQSLDPGGTSQGAQNFAVSIAGFDTHWVQGKTTASFGAGISVVSLKVVNATTATACLMSMWRPRLGHALSR